MQQFLRASTYMLPVSMVLANIYQPYKVCLAMFSCYLFQHGLFIWKLFLGISILTVTSFKWQFLCFFVFCQEPRHSNAQCFCFFFFCCILPSEPWSLLTGSPYLVHTCRGRADWRHSHWVSGVCCQILVASLLQANPHWIYLGVIPLWRICARNWMGIIFLGGGLDSWVSYF